MNFQKNQLVLQCEGCQTDGKKKRVEMNRPIEKSGGIFADSVSKSEEMVWYPVLSISLYPAMGTGLGRAWISTRVWI
jgi:hypothetical protein